MFVTDVSAGKVKIVTSLSETISFLGILASLYDTFGIHSKGMKPEGVFLKQAKENVTKIDNYVKDTVSKVKKRYQLSETSATIRACQQSVCYTIRQGCSCICASRHVTVRGNNGCLYDVRDDL